MPTTQKAYSRARPVRVAFFVDDHEHSGIMLDAIFKNCMGRWGGRFSLIMPATMAGPNENYLAWLEVFDPDIIYSYVDLDNTVVERLHERFYPSFLIRHDPYHASKNEARAYHPNLPIDCLKASSLIPMATLPSPFDKIRNGYFLEGRGRLREDSFVRDSFGFFGECVGHGYFGPLNEFGSTVTLVADDDCQPRERYPDAKDAISNIPALLDFASSKKLITMTQLSALATPRLDIDSRKWGSNFNIIVGDTFTDRIVYWNARSLFPKWRDREVVDLIIPSNYLNEPDILDAIGKFITKRNNMSDQGGNSTPRATIRSSSVSADNLVALAATLKGKTSWVQYSTEIFSTIEDCQPTAEELERANFTVAENFMTRSEALWKETYVNDEQLDINPPVPEPLKHHPTSFQLPHNGIWAIDIDIDRQVNHSLVSNIHHRWRFPRRLRIINAFLKGYEIPGSSSSYVMPRVNNDGLLTLYTNMTLQLPSIRMPDDETALKSAFISGRNWAPFIRRTGEQMPEQLLQDVRRSENGRYFAGTLGVFKTLKEANEILLHGFWKDQFEKLGSSSKQTDIRRQEVENSLANRFGVAGAELPRDKATLANIILKEADSYRTSIPFRSWKTLEEDFISLQNRYRQENPTVSENATEEAEYIKNEQRLFVRGVQDLCEKGVLYQGYEHRCRKCLHKSWFAISNLSPKIKCKVCMSEEPAPVNWPWHFRLNEFVRESLRGHGVWPLFWVLSKVRKLKENSFYFAGPLDIYLNGSRWDQDRPDTDIDLVIISDGLVRMCEVKQSERQLKEKDFIKNFSQLMLRLRPDIATLAVMAPETDDIRKKFSDFSQQLNGSGIKPELLTLNENKDFDSSPSFYRVTRISLF